MKEENNHSFIPNAIKLKTKFKYINHKYKTHHLMLTWIYIYKFCQCGCKKSLQVGFKKSTSQFDFRCAAQMWFKKNAAWRVECGMSAYSMRKWQSITCKENTTTKKYGKLTYIFMDYCEGLPVLCKRWCVCKRYRSYTRRGYIWGNCQGPHVCPRIV